ncbi:beta-galactosidase [Candidatus Calescamantes bacterium]|nr:beta-galactosidase [Candidatus Calescamantes bacterium]
MAISYTKNYFVIEDRPLFIFSGEAQYFRLHPSDWRDRMLKMQQAGLNTISTYVPWNWHEKEKGKYDFKGNKDLGQFIDIAKECGLYVIVRIGPFIHAEWRNGGLPDWLIAELGEQVRTNNEKYFKYVKQYFDNLCEIITPRQITRGGNIILVQIENELQSSGSKGDDIPPGSGGVEHVLRLHSMVRELGIEVPLLDLNRFPERYKMEGVIPASGLYLDTMFYGERTFPKFDLPHPFRKEGSGKPLFSIETQCGSPNRFFDYPVYSHTSTYQGPITIPPLTEAVVLTLIGVGYSGINFYIFADGQNPDGFAEAMNPPKDYNFQESAISACGTFRKSYGIIKRIGWMLRSFGNLLLTAEPSLKFCEVITNNEPLPLASLCDLRLDPSLDESSEFAIGSRQKLECISRLNEGLGLGRSKFIVIRNYDKFSPKSYRNVQIRIIPSGLSTELPKQIPQKIQFNIPQNSSKIIPFYVKLKKKVFLEYSTAELLDNRVLDNKLQLITLYTDEHEWAEIKLVLPEQVEAKTLGNGVVSWESPNSLLIIANPGKDLFIVSLPELNIQIVLLSKPLAESVWDINTPYGKTFLMTNMVVLDSKVKDHQVNVRCQTMVDHIYFYMFTLGKPAFNSESMKMAGEYYSEFALWKGNANIKLPLITPRIDKNTVPSGLKYTITLPSDSFSNPDLKDLVFITNYDGDNAQAFLDGALISDHYFGKFTPWEFGVRNYIKRNKRIDIVMLMNNAKEAKVFVHPIINFTMQISL